MNMLDVPLRCEPKHENFKIGLKDWVKANIAIKPKSKESYNKLLPVIIKLRIELNFSSNLIGKL